MYYAAIGILALLILVIENQDILFKRSKAFDKKPWVVYRRFLFAIIVYYVTDILWGVIEYYKLSTLLFIDTTVYFFAMASCIILWSACVFYYLDEKNRIGKSIVYAGYIIATFIAGITILNIFFPILFTVDDECVYKALPVRYTVIAAQILILILISVYALTSIRRKMSSRGHEPWNKYRTIALFGAIMATFLFIQLWFPYLPVYSIALMLGTCLVRTFVIGDEKEKFRNELEEANKIAELQHTISSLLDNMPAMCFSKDAETGVYLACNQGFVEYAHKEKPEDVLGLTDADIFDAATAAHFVEADRITMSMDEPYVFYEDVPDAAGIQTKLQTTKMKYIDTSGRLCVLGMCQDITELVRVQRENEHIKEAHRAFNRINALAGDFLCVYAVIPETGYYREFSTAESFKITGMAQEGDDFFKDFKEHCRNVIHQEDYDRFNEAFRMGNILSDIAHNGIFAVSCRMLLGGAPRHVQIKASVVEEESGRRLIVGVNDIEALVCQEQEIANRLLQAQSKANIDALTGVKTKYAYNDIEERLNSLINGHAYPAFAVVILDINDLKLVNDTQGHQAGDQYIRDACKIVCETFKRSPVYRVGGDEFAVVSQGEDYERIDELVGKIKKHNEEAVKNGGIVIAVGMSRYNKDDSVAAVYERADSAMYENKVSLKEGRSVR
ncbi:MAG: diguanylate cyclase [Lachnospiraceae bacterium]|nr:diguanylate cyclase [Lachnospiraceae bacterium]